MVFKGDSGVMKASHLLILFALAVSFATAASAAVIDIDDGDKEIWVQSDDATLNGHVDCSTGAAPNSVNVTGPDGNPIAYDGSAESFSVDFDTSSSFGEYTIDGSCSDGEPDQKTFKAKMLDIQLTDPAQGEDVTVYQGQEFGYTVDVEAKGAETQPSSQELEFSAEFTGSKSRWIQNANPSGSASSPFDLNVEVPDRISTGETSFEPRVKYKEDYHVSVQSYLDVLKPWRFTVTNRTPEDSRISYDELNQLSMNVQVEETGNPKGGLVESDFYVTVKDGEGNIVKDYKKERWMNMEVMSQKNGKYRLKMDSRPPLDIGRYKFIIGLDREGGKKIISLPVYNYLSLRGKILDAKGEPVDTKIEAEKDGVIRQFNVQSGAYSADMLPGEYNFTVSFPKAIVDFKDVNLQPGVKGAIKYNEIPPEDLNTGFEGVEVVNALRITFGYPFKSASMEMSYDASKVGFSEVKILECKGWNPLERNCRGDWNVMNDTEIKIFPTVGRAIFPASPVNISDGRKKMLNAYLVVKNTKLLSEDVSIGESRVPVDSSIPIEGRIVTPNGDQVQDAQVNVSLLKAGEVVKKASLQTDSSGIFGTQLRAPSKKGIYSFRISAEKTPHIGFEKSLDQTVETYIQQGIGVSVPDQVSFTPGERVETEFTVVNTGQSELNNVKLYIRDLNNDWYSFQQNSWDSLGPGASRTAVMITELPEDYCEGECREYPTFQVEATAVSGDNPDINAIESVRAEVTKEANATSTSTSDDDEEGGMNIGNPAKITGDFIEQRSSLNIAIGLITVFMLVLAAAVKKKNEGSGRGSVRSSVSTGGGRSSGRTTVEKPKVSSERNGEEEETDNSGADGKEESSEDDESEEHEDDSGKDGFTCPECGEEFDTESALELHKDINEVE